MEDLKLTGAEKVIYKSHYDFAINVQKLSEAEAAKLAETKIRQKRQYAKTLTFRY